MDYNYIESCIAIVDKIDNRSLASAILRLQKPTSSSTSLSSSIDASTVKPIDLNISKCDDDDTSVGIDMIEFINDYLKCRHLDNNADASSFMNMDIYSDTIILSACIDSFLIIDDAIDLLSHKKEYESMTGNSQLRCIKYGVFDRINPFVIENDFGKDKICFDYFAGLSYAIIAAMSMKPISTNAPNSIDIIKNKDIFEKCLLDRLAKFINIIHPLSANELHSKYPNKAVMLLSAIGDCLRLSCLHIKKASEDDNFSRICSVGKGMRIRQLAKRSVVSDTSASASSDGSINNNEVSSSQKVIEDDVAASMILEIGKPYTDNDSNDLVDSSTMSVESVPEALFGVPYELISAAPVPPRPSSSSSVVLSNLSRRKKTKVVESCYGGSVRTTVLPKGIYQINSGFRVQLNQVRGSSQKFSRNATSFIEAVWLFEVAMLMSDKPKYLYSLQIAGNYSAIMSMDVGITSSLQYYLELGNWISFLSRGGPTASSRCAPLTFENSQLASKLYDDLIPIPIDQVIVSPSSSTCNSLCTDEKVAMPSLSAKDRGFTCLCFPMPALYLHICLCNAPPQRPFLYSSMEYDSASAALAYVASQGAAYARSQGVTYIETQRDFPFMQDDLHVSSDDIQMHIEC